MLKDERILADEFCQRNAACVPKQTDQIKNNRKLIMTLPVVMKEFTQQCVVFSINL
jgi:hypothetical protein